MEEEVVAVVLQEEPEEVGVEEMEEVELLETMG